MRTLRLLALLPALVALAACDGTPACNTTNVKLSDLRANVFKTSCEFSACHKAADMKGKLDLQTDPYAALVNVAPDDVAAQMKGWKRVVPGDAANSFLYSKLTMHTDPMCSQTCKPPTCCLGDPMPDTGQTLDQCSIDQFKSWIVAGAPNN